MDPEVCRAAVPEDDCISWLRRREEKLQRDIEAVLREAAQSFASVGFIWRQSWAENLLYFPPKTS